MPERGRVAVLVPAGGAGTRLGRRTPKQFLRLGGDTILAATVRRFVRHPAVDAVVVAAPAAYVERTRRLLGRLRARARIVVVAGGPSRQASVRQALAAAPASADVLLVHDAVRPFVTRALVDAVIAAALAEGAAICALPVAETVKRVRDGMVEATVERDGLWAVQTPQGFRAALLREAHDKAVRDGVVGTDDAMLVERLGHPVRVVPGLSVNVKITTPADLRRVRRSLR
jgi:2-C-methyl-D-erythritol 4-phosphate cytidylyltransferase